MLQRTGRIIVAAMLGMIVVIGSETIGAAGEPSGVPSARGAIEPPAPMVPAVVVAALQEARYHDARRALSKLAEDAKDGEDRAYYLNLRGVAERLAGDRDAARATFEAAERAAPSGRWSARIRYGRTALDQAMGNMADAEERSRQEAERLLAPDRKDRLAGIYRAFADRLLASDDPLIKPDPKAAREILERGRDLARSKALRARFLEAMSRADLTANDAPRAVADCENYLKEYPDGEDRDAVRLRLGDAYTKINQPVPARRTWSDLARDIGKRKPDGRVPELDAIRASALYRIASTYGIPKPPDDASLHQGIAALRRFLTEAPSHPKAVRAAFEIGASAQSRGRSTEALDAFDHFLREDGFKIATDAARHDWAELSMSASFEVARILQGQRRFAEAIAAWKGYLARFPDGPRGADAQRAILDTELMIADDHLEHERYDEARAAWSGFVSRNPLDARVPSILHQIGQSFVKEKRYDRALAAWDALVSRFPDSEPAAHARFDAAALLETEKGDLAGAIERFRQINVEPWKSRAQQRIAVMESKSLTVVTPRAFRSGETAHLKIATRNLETLRFEAYRLDAEAYFRAREMLGNVEALDISLVAPDATWTAPVADYARYRPIEASYELKPLELPGVYAVRVTDEKTLQATTMVIGSDIDAIIKTSREQLLVFAQDRKTGRGRAGARVLVADGKRIVLEAKTGDDGVLLHEWKPARGASENLQYLVLDGAHVAGTGLAVPGRLAQGLSPRAYLYTDRPAYRPGQTVAIRGVVREVQGGRYANLPKAVYRLEVADSRGRLLIARPLTLSEFGTFHTSLPIDTGAPLGTYRITVSRPGGSAFSGGFEVHAYQLQPIDLSIHLEKAVVYRGEPVRADVVARHHYGTPMPGRPIEIDLPDNRTLHGTTDARGRYHFEFPTDGFSEAANLRLVARLPQDNVSEDARVAVAVRGFEIALSTARDVYLDGESFALRVTTTDPLGEPIGTALSALLIKRIKTDGRINEREVKREKVTTDPKTGLGTVTFHAEDAQGGSYILRVTGNDRAGTAIVADRPITVSGKKDTTRLRILADRVKYRVGEEASINLHSRGRTGPALLTWEADRILQYRIADLKDGDNAIAWAVDNGQFPNFTLTAARMWENECDQARLDVQVERDLRVTVTPSKTTVGPGEPIELDIKTVDQLGRPVSAELSIAMVDRSLLRLFDDRLPEIGAFFYNQTRTGAFSTRSTNIFRYQPRTTPVSRSVVEEAERSAALAANADARKRMNRVRVQQLIERGAVDAKLLEKTRDFRDQADRETAGRAGIETESRFFVPNAKNAPQAPPSGAEMRGMMGGMGGGMGDKEPIRDAQTYKDIELSRMAGKPRERSVESAYWNPSVVTGADGKARVTFKAPNALSEYEIKARGITGADTLAGQTSTSLTVKKNFYVDLKRPAVLTEGDKPQFIATVHHNGVRGKLSLKLATYAGGRDDVFPKTQELKGDGVEEFVFEPYEVPAGDVLRVTLNAAVGDTRDELIEEIPIRPWGVPVYASASGTSADGTTVLVGLPAGRTYADPELIITLSPTVRRMLVELAVGGPGIIHPVYLRSLPPIMNTTADRASELLAAASVLGYLRDLDDDAPEAGRLTGRIRSLAAELIAAQNQDGGWPWIAGGKHPSERYTSASAMWALARAERLGLLSDPKVLDLAVHYLHQQFAKAGASDIETRAAMLHALSTRGAADFESANRLNRSRDQLSDPSLAALALTFTNLERPTLAQEILTLLGQRAKQEPAGPDQRPRLYWDGAGRQTFARSPAEITGMVALAYARAKPDANELAPAIDWLDAHRLGPGWHPHKAIGPALSAMSLYHGRARTAEDRYRLTVTVNDAQVAVIDVQGPVASKTIAVPRAQIKVDQPNRIRFAIEGRGRFGYSAVLTGFTQAFGPDQERAQRIAWIDRRAYQPAAPEVDGKTLPVGFSVAVNPKTFENQATQVTPGGRVRVALTVTRDDSARAEEWERDFLVVRDHLPAGTSLIEGSVHTPASSFELADGVLTFYFPPGASVGTTTYDLLGFVPGRYRVLPPSVRSAYEPGQYHLGQPDEFRVLAPGEANTDPYRSTPDELYARGKAHFDAGRFAKAGAALSPLFEDYTLRDDIARDAARMLLEISLHEKRPRPIVQYFEVVRDRSPGLYLTFDQLLAIGSAYRDIKEYERAAIVWRGLIEASYLEDARIGELLHQRGKTLESLAYLIDLWRAYPPTPSIDADFFGLSQLYVQTASRAINDPSTRHALADAGITRSQLLLQSIRMIQTFLAGSPRNPMADEASLALIGAFIELEDFESVVRLSERFAKVYKKSSYLDSFQYSEALGAFHLGHYDQAIAVAETIAKATYKDADGLDQPSPNKWQALDILGQIHDARGQPGRALTYYRQVADRFTDAADAIKAFTRKALKVPEVTTIRPSADAKPASVTLDYRNIAKVDVKVYPVDLLKFYLTSRNLSGIARVNLAGITPMVDRTITLGDGADYADKTKRIELPLEKEGAYLLMIRGGDLHTSGIVLVTPMEIEVVEQSITIGPNSVTPSRVRVMVRNARTHDPMPKVEVKMIGSQDRDFVSGETDLRGVFAAEGIGGTVTVVVRKGTRTFAFYRGTQPIAGSSGGVGGSGLPGRMPTPPHKAEGSDRALDANLRQQNAANSQKQVERLQQRLGKPSGSNQAAPAGEFR